MRKFTNSKDCLKNYFFNLAGEIGKKKNVEQIAKKSSTIKEAEAAAIDMRAKIY